MAARLCLQIVRIAFMHAARTSARFVTELAQDALLLVFFAWLIAGRKGAARMYANAIGITGLALYAGLIVVLLPMLVSISGLVDTISVYAFPFFLEGMEALLMMVNAISPRYLHLGEDEYGGPFVCSSCCCAVFLLFLLLCGGVLARVGVWCVLVWWRVG